MKYLVWCRRHDSIYGKWFALFWGWCESKSGYSSDLRFAHRFTEEEIKRFDDDMDIPIPIDFLGISEGYESAETFNKKINILVETGMLNKFLK